MSIIPSPPTDSLYKFLAISGLAICVFSYAYPTQVSFDLDMKIIDLEAKVQKNATKLAYLKQRLNLVEAKLKENKVDQTPLLELMKSTQEFSEAFIESEADQKKTEAAIKQSRKYDVFSVVGILLGFGMAVAGFVLWYVRIQNPEDQLIKKRKTRAV